MALSSDARRPPADDRCELSAGPDVRLRRGRVLRRLQDGAGVVQAVRVRRVIGGRADPSGTSRTCDDLPAAVAAGPQLLAPRVLDALRGEVRSEPGSERGEDPGDEGAPRLADGQAPGLGGREAGLARSLTRRATGGSSASSPTREAPDHAELPTAVGDGRIGSLPAGLSTAR